MPERMYYPDMTPETPSPMPNASYCHILGTVNSDTRGNLDSLVLRESYKRFTQTAPVESKFTKQLICEQT